MKYQVSEVCSKVKCEQLLSTIIRGKVVRAVSALARIVVTFQQIINKGRKIMKKRMKKLASLLLSVSMTFSMISFPVYATPADDTENETAVTTESPETEEPADAAGETTERKISRSKERASRKQSAGNQGRHL